ncbi:putative Cell cycle regulated microtubule associated protein [Hibiscus syriacus]|uniref:Cell cycle regulated microtubule associated protein n=1 Tax=Hibiscus syriacus TaxID=106335 RepID=A0A6A2XJB3_HIBSY|nr:uncharacterized protein LOC120186735 [Hibiscus syriacus]KAE8662106.1 putative Cell cycle regulated microtubule associated protein [Hibiscus syriacus]
MVEMEAKADANKRKIRQPPSVPFLWEVRPGIAKKDWKPADFSVTPTTLPPPTPTPIKLIASVPFNWEEKPGTPLHSFSQPAVEPATLPPPPAYSPAHFNGCIKNDEQEAFEMELEAFGFKTDDAFSSPPSTAVSTIFAEQKISSPVSETDSASSYATGAASLAGASFLERLFPLLSPRSGFLEHESRARIDFELETNYTVVIRRPPTLEELIMMSRRRSYQRKAAQIREKNISTEFLEERAPGCCIFGTDIVEGLQLKFQPRLRFF